MMRIIVRGWGCLNVRKKTINLEIWAPDFILVVRSSKLVCQIHANALIKNKIKFFLYIRKFRRKQCKVIHGEGFPNIWGNTQIFSHVWGGL